MAIYQLGDDIPLVPSSAYVAEDAVIIGKVMLGEHASIWPGAVIRADNDTISVGDNSNIQDGTVLHADPGFPLKIGNNVTVGHLVMLHGCTIGDGSLIGIQAVVMNGAVIGNECLVGAGAIVTEGKQFPPRQLILGAPARALRELKEDDIQMLHRANASYIRRQEIYRNKLKRIG